MRLGSGEVERQQRGRAAASGRMGGGRAGSPPPPKKNKNKRGGGAETRRVVEAFEEGGLQLGQEGLEPGARALHQQPQRGQDRGLEGGGEAVADDADERACAVGRGLCVCGFGESFGWLGFSWRVLMGFG